ncbi:hypothetical protein HZA99_06780 [Candidatus Woesearchaeota archaeon]|nr:hypothetical protein [Candidatus Woesearchaeota archaeon]
MAFQEQSVSADIIIPITLVSSGTQTTVEEFHTEIPTSFPELYALSKKIADKTFERKGYFPITYSTMITAEKGYNLEYTAADDASIISLIDPKSIYGEQQLFFTFALSNPASASSPADAVKIEEITSQTASIYYPFSFTIHAAGENVQFNDTTDLFDIDEKTGTRKSKPDHANYIF